MKIGIVGLGYVGLPIAVAFAEAEHEVVGLDADPRKVESIGEGRSYIEDIGDDVLAWIGERLHATSRYADLASCNAVILLVPTPLSGAPAAHPSPLPLSPEPIRPARTDYAVRTTPKLLGDITEPCTERAREVYAEIC